MFVPVYTFLSLHLSTSVNITVGLFQEPSFETQLKRARRRERNKVAAAKCRFKKKMISEKLQEVKL